MAPLEPWEKVLVDNVAFSETVHGQIACVDCHNGVQSADKNEAHTDLVVSPSEYPEKYCGECKNRISCTKSVLGGAGQANRYGTSGNPEYADGQEPAHDQYAGQ